MNAWGQAEGGGGYGRTGEGQFNWLNTRRGAGSNWSQPDFQTGVRNTIGALQDGYYTNIVAALRGGRASAPQLATMVANSKWGTHDGVLRVLGAAPTHTPSTVQGFSGTTAGQNIGIAPATSAASESRARAPFTPSSAVLGQLFQSFNNTLAGHPDMSGLLALASARSQYQSAQPISPVAPGGVPAAAVGTHGQMTYSGYVNPIPHGSVFERNDQGVDYRTPVGSNIPALGNARVVRVSNNAGGFGKAIYYRLLDGPAKGRYVYVGHADPMAQAGQYLRAGQTVARSRQTPFGNAAGTPGHIETGWAGSPFGPLGALGSSNQGSNFLNFLRGLGG
jgi:murein DD-endopeptidase MepM/ murein hydrolase activator NlpD